jgi:hypothetical protein
LGKRVGTPVEARPYQQKWLDRIIEAADGFALKKSKWNTQAKPVKGHREKANRNGFGFRCKKCGYSCHADLNGAMNISNIWVSLTAWDGVMTHP